MNTVAAMAMQHMRAMRPAHRPAVAPRRSNMANPTFVGPAPIATQQNSPEQTDSKTSSAECHALTAPRSYSRSRFVRLGASDASSWSRGDGSADRGGDRGGLRELEAEVG